MNNSQEEKPQNLVKIGEVGVVNDCIQAQQENENDIRCFASGNSARQLTSCSIMGDRVIAPAHNGLNAYLLSCNIVKYLCPLAIGGKGLLADKTAYLTDTITTNLASARTTGFLKRLVRAGQKTGIKDSRNK